MSRIALVHPSFYMYGGAERLIVILSNYLVDQGNFVSIFTSKIIDPIRNDLKARICILDDIQELKLFTEHLSLKYELVISHNHPCEAMVPSGVKHIWHCNEPPPESLEGRTPPQLLKLIRGINEVVVNSEYDRKRFNTLFGKDPIVNYPGIRSDFFSVKTEMDRFGLKDSFAILHCANFGWNKQQHKSVEIFSKIKKKIPNSKLVLAGFNQFEYAKLVYQKITELGLTKDVIVTGFLNDVDVRDLYNVCKVQILPILDQGGWINVFESIYAGLPTITSPQFIGSDLMLKHSLGKVVDVESFADAVLEIYENYSYYKNQTAKASQWIGENLTWDKFCKKYDEIIGGML